MRLACWIPKATGTHSECQILIAFPRQHWLRERASLLHYTITIRRLGAELFHADGQTDRHDEANSRFSQFGERASKKQTCLWTGLCLWKGARNVFVNVLMLVFDFILLDAFANCKKRLLASSCQSVRPHGTTRLPLDGFS